MTQENLATFVKGFKELDCNDRYTFLKNKIPSMSLVTLLKLFKVFVSVENQSQIFEHVVLNLNHYRLEENEIAELQEDFDSSLLRFVLFTQYQNNLSYDYLRLCEQKFLQTPNHENNVSKEQIYPILLQNYPEKISNEELIELSGYEYSRVDGSFKEWRYGEKVAKISKKIFLAREISFERLIDMIIQDETPPLNALVKEKILSLDKSLLDKDNLLKYIRNTSLPFYKEQKYIYYLLVDNFIDDLNLKECIEIWDADSRGAHVEINIIVTKISSLIINLDGLILAAQEIGGNTFEKIIQSKTAAELGFGIQDIRKQNIFWKHHDSTSYIRENLRSIYLIIQNEVSEKILRDIIYFNGELRNFDILIIELSVELLLTKFSENISLNEAVSIAKKTSFSQENVVRKLLIQHGTELCTQEPTFENILLFHSYIAPIRESCGDDIAIEETLFGLIKNELQYDSIEKSYEEYKSAYKRDDSFSTWNNTNTRELPVFEYLLRIFKDEETEKFKYLESLLS